MYEKCVDLLRERGVTLEDIADLEDEKSRGHDEAEVEAATLYFARR